jgi:uncharacterized protein
MEPHTHKDINDSVNEKSSKRTIEGNLEVLNSNFSRGIRALKNRRFVDALNLLLPIAEKGNSEAQFKVGEIYSTGRKEIPEDDEKAWEWNQKAAEQGHTIALAYLLFESVFARRDHLTHIPVLDEKEIQKSLQRVITDLRAMADNNCLDAMSWLGFLSMLGISDDLTIDEGIQFFEMATNLGDADAMAMHATMLLLQDQSGENLPDVINRLEKALERGCSTAALFLGNIFFDGIGSARDPVKAYGHFAFAAEEGDPESAFKAGNCKANGVGTEQNDEDALEWYLLAAKGGQREAQYSISQIDRRLTNVQLSDEEKFGWLCESARRGYPPALNALGWDLIIQEYGDDTVEQGIKYLRQSAKLGDADAQFKLGVLYNEGIGVPEDESTAANWWKVSADNGDADGQSRYGFALLYGNGVDQNPQLAEHYFLQAFTQGNSVAAIGLGFVHHLIKYDNVKALGFLTYGAKRLNEDEHSPACELIHKLHDQLTVDDIAMAHAHLNQLEGRFAN